MAAHILSRSLLPQSTKTLIASLLSRSFSSCSTPSPSSSLPRSISILRVLRPLSAVAASNISFLATGLATVRCFSTRPTSSSLNDPSPNWSNRPPKETILLDGCDFEHWLVVVDKPEGDPTRDEIIDSYIKTLAKVVGSDEEARMKIYSVSTRCYYAFGALVSEELSYKLKELPHVRWVLPDSYLDVKNKDYGGEPFINGKAVPYDPKYHEEWIRNNARANERNRRNDRPRNFDRSRNFERRRENMQQQFQSSTPNQGMHNSPPNMGGMQQNNMSRPAGPPPPPPPPPPPNYNTGGPQNMNVPGGPPPPNYNTGGPQNINVPGGPPPPNYNMGGPQNNMSGPGGPPPPSSNYRGGMPNNMGGMPNNSMGGMPYNSTGGFPQNNMGGVPQTGGWSNSPQNNMGGVPQTGGWSNSMPGNMQQNFQNGPNNEGMPYQGAQPNYQQNAYTPNRDGSMPSGTQ